MKYLGIFYFYILLWSRPVAAVSWQCPGHQPSVELKRVEHLDFMKMDRYRGYKPAWMAVDKSYRAAIYGWNDEVTRNAYLQSGDAYLDFYMYHEKLRQLMERYPTKVEVWEIARTHFGFPVYAVLVGNSTETTKADILHIASIHGNEMLTVNYALDAIVLLLDDDKQQFSALKSRFNFWFVPMANPDGNWLSMRRAHASTYGKKNGRNTDGTCETFAYEGVDLSDNFPVKNIEQEIEAEVAGLVQLVESRNFVLGLSLHTGGHGFFTPPKMSTEGQEDRITLERFSTDLAKTLVGFERRDLRRDTELQEITWMYKEKQMPAFIFDYPEDIAPKSGQDRAEARVLFQGFIQGFWGSLDQQAFLEGSIVNQQGEAISGARLHQVQSLRQELVWAIPDNGQFSMIFPSKKVITLRVTAEGYVDAEKRIDLRDGAIKTKIVLLKKSR